LATRPGWDTVLESVHALVTHEWSSIELLAAALLRYRQLDYNEAVLYRGKLTVVKEPLFPGYVFIELLSNQRCVPINSTSGVRRLLTWQPEDSEYLAPARVPDEFVCGCKAAVITARTMTTKPSGGSYPEPGCA
jgi:transcription antitermination factor NusG